jgi:hypothetical protein
MRNFTKLALGLVAIGVCLGAAAPAQAQVCGVPMSTTLVAGQTMSAGTVSVYNDAANLYIRYTLTSPWVMSDAHAAVATTLAGLPQTKTGNPIPGRFSYSATFDPEVTSYTFGVPMAGNFTAGQVVFIAAHAGVQAPRAYGGAQTGWGQGSDFPGSNWAMYLNYQVQSCGGGGSPE